MKSYSAVCGLEGKGHWDAAVTEAQSRPDCRTFISFIAVRELSISDKLSDLVAEALNGNHVPCGD